MLRSFVLRLLGTAAFFTAIVILGAYGYMVIEQWEFMDSLYMSVITITMVGYQEVFPLSPEGRLFTMILLALGLTGLGVWFAMMTSFIVEMDLLVTFQKRRMLKDIRKLSNHIVVCGAGRTGVRLIDELEPAHKEVVVIERSPTKAAAVREEHPNLRIIEGDATQDHTLEMAGLDRARALMSCLGNDRDNLFVCLSAKQMNPLATVVVRAYDEESADKLFRAGADHVVSPTISGAIRMASIILRPSVVSFLDVATRSPGGVALRLEQATVGRKSLLNGQSLRDSQFRQETGLMVVAVRQQEADGEFVFNPEADMVLTEGDEVIVLGRPEQIEAFTAHG